VDPLGIATLYFNGVHILYNVMDVVKVKRLRNETYSFLTLLVARMTPLNVILHKVAIYKNVTTAMNDNLLYWTGDQLSSASFSWLSSVLPGTC
jgi:hypothetical protein